MGILEYVSKFLIERGSAEVQSKHIALLKEQLALALGKIAELESENALLKAKNQDLAKENEALHLQIQKYGTLVKPRKQTIAEPWNPFDGL